MSLWWWGVREDGPRMGGHADIPQALPMVVGKGDLVAEMMIQAPEQQEQEKASVIFAQCGLRNLPH